MNLKFNNGRGALICDQCSIIIMDRFFDYEWQALLEMQDKGFEWFCKSCCYACQNKQVETFINFCNEKALPSQKLYRKEIEKKFGFLN